MVKGPILQVAHVKKLAKLLHETDVHEIEYEINGQKIRVVRHKEIHQAVNNDNQKPILISSTPDNQKEPEKEKEKDEGIVHITSPIVGTAYTSESPESEPFVKVGDKVKKDQTILIVEAMKVMNPIRSPYDGIVHSILADNAQPVEYDQPLIAIKL